MEARHALARIESGDVFGLSTTKTTGLGPTIDLTGDISNDMDRIRALYADTSGVKPEHRVEPRLREELAT